MKKISLTLAAAIIVTIVTTSSIYAQNSKNDLVFTDSPKNQAATKSDIKLPGGSLNTKAEKSFHKAFKTINGETWVPAKDGIVAKFIKDGIHTMVYYNKKGTWMGTLRYLSEDLLPKDVRHTVKSEYYDFSISNIVEVTVGDKTAYLITMEDKTSIKQVKVVDGEMEVTHDYKKSE